MEANSHEFNEWPKFLASLAKKMQNLNERRVLSVCMSIPGQWSKRIDYIKGSAVGRSCHIRNIWMDVDAAQSKRSGDDI